MSTFKRIHESYIISPMMEQPGIIHAFSTRCGGVSHGYYSSLNLNFKVGDDPAFVERNRELFCATLGVSYKKLVTLNQVHGDEILLIDSPPDDFPQADALITATPGIALGVQTADCVPILISDPVNKIVAAVHAGWRGTALRILMKTLRKMEFAGANLQNCKVVIGPSIGRCCYQVDEKVICELEKNKIPWKLFSKAEKDNHWRLDLARINQWQAAEAGVPANNISCMKLCTACEEELFFSYRRQPNSGRMMSLIALS